MVRPGAALVLGLLLAGPPAEAAPIRIMVIGDSLVQGGHLGSDEFTFRYPLYQGLRTAGFEVDFVGARQKGLDPDYPWPPDFDPDHEGFYGATTLEIEAEVTADLARLPAPDFAIFLLGENDGTDDVARKTIAPVERLIGRLRARQPRVGILLIQVPGFWKEMGLHGAVSALARRLSTPGSPVLTVPLHEHWDTWKDTFDGDHPNPRGQRKIAELVLERLVPLLP